MKLTTRLIKAKADFDYGRANGLNYVATLLQFATFVEVIHADRRWYFVLIPLGVIGTWLFGVFLRKINFRKRETDFINRENEAFMEIRNAITKRKDDSA